MTSHLDKQRVVLALPPFDLRSVPDRRLKQWLARGDHSRSDAPTELLHRVTGSLGLPRPPGGLAGLRFWGQTGDRPSVWLACADPVYFEPLLDHLRLHRLPAAELDPAEISEIFAVLQHKLGDEQGFGFAHVACRGYLRGATSGPVTAELSPDALDGLEPSPHLPIGEDAGAYHRLQSEIQMTLHLMASRHADNAPAQRRINALWLWGGGIAPAPSPKALPPLFAEDPLLHGYWNFAEAPGARWPGSLDDCLRAAPRGFVAVVPEAPPDAGTDSVLERLDEARSLLDRGHVRRLDLLFANGSAVSLTRRHRLRVWRRSWPPAGDGESP